MVSSAAPSERRLQQQRSTSLSRLYCASAVFTTGQALPITIAAIALSIAPILIEARKELDPTEDEFDPVRRCTSVPGFPFAPQCSFCAAPLPDSSSWTPSSSGSQTVLPCTLATRAHTVHDVIRSSGMCGQVAECFSIMLRRSRGRLADAKMPAATGAIASRPDQSFAVHSERALTAHSTGVLMAQRRHHMPHRRTGWHTANPMLWLSVMFSCPCL